MSINVIASLLSTVSYDGSTTVTLGGTAQNLFSGITPPHGFAIYNPDATHDLWVSDSTTAAANAAGSVRVPSNGGSFVTPDFYRPVGPVSVFGGTTTQAITAKGW